MAEAQEILDAGARAAAEAAGFSWEACAQNQWRRDAQATLCAAFAKMEEPSEALILAGLEGEGSTGWIVQTWQTMIRRLRAEIEALP